MIHALDNVDYMQHVTLLIIVLFVRVENDILETLLAAVIHSSLQYKLNHLKIHVYLPLVDYLASATTLEIYRPALVCLVTLARHQDAAQNVQ